MIKRYLDQKMSVADMRMFRWMRGNTKRDKVRNENILTKIGVTPYRRKYERKSPMMVWPCMT